jgi:hypothetical protein
LGLCHVAQTHQSLILTLAVSPKPEDDISCGHFTFEGAHDHRKQNHRISSSPTAANDVMVLLKADHAAGTSTSKPESSPRAAKGKQTCPIHF